MENERQILYSTIGQFSMGFAFFDTPLCSWSISDKPLCTCENMNLYSILFHIIAVYQLTLFRLGGVVFTNTTLNNSKSHVYSMFQRVNKYCKFKLGYLLGPMMIFKVGNPFGTAQEFFESKQVGFSRIQKYIKLSSLLPISQSYFDL